MKKKLVKSNTLFFLVLCILFFNACSSKPVPSDFLKGCKEGNSQYCAFYGAYLFDKNKKITPEALRFAKKGCSLSNADSCYLVAKWLDEQKKIIQSLKYSNKACHLNSYEGCQLYGQLSIKTSMQSKLDYLKAACLEKSQGKSCFRYAKHQVKQSKFKLAKQYFLKGCSFNDDKSCKSLKNLIIKYRRASSQTSSKR